MLHLRRTPRALAAPLAAIAALALAACSSTAVEGEPIEYSAGDTDLQGYLARPAGAADDLPAVIVVHEWWGHNDYARERADMLAKAGYVAFALDMYGDGKTAAHPSDATEFMQAVMGDAEVMEARFDAAIEVVEGTAGVDPERIAAIGYCMGGGIVLRMARTNDDLKAVASFHGSLGAALDAGDGGSCEAVYIAHGGADEFVSMETFEKLVAQLKALGPIERVLTSVYVDAKHGFTNPAASTKGAEFGLPLAYDGEADEASWSILLGFLEAHLGEG